MIEFECPHCGNEFRVPAESAGRDGWCRVCKRMVIVPNPDGTGLQWDDLRAEERVARLDKLLQFAATKADKLKVLLQKYSVEDGKLIPAADVSHLRVSGTKGLTSDGGQIAKALAQANRERDEAIVDRDTHRIKCEALQARLQALQDQEPVEPDEELYLEKLMLEASVQSAEEKIASLKEESRSLRKAYNALERERESLATRLFTAETSHQETTDASTEALKALEAEAKSLRARLETAPTADAAVDAGELERLHERVGSLEERELALTAERDAAKHALDEATETLNALRETCAGLETEAAEARARASALGEAAEQRAASQADAEDIWTSRAESAEAALNEARQTIDELEASNGQALQEQERLRQAAAVEQEKSSAFEARLAEVERTLELAQAERDNALADASAARTEADTYQAELSTFREQWSAEKRSLSRSGSSRPLEEEIGRLQRDLGDARASRAAAELERRAAEGKLRQATEREAEREASHKALQADAEAMRVELETLRQQQATIEQDAAALRRERDLAVSEVDALRRDVESARIAVSGALRGNPAPGDGTPNWVFAETPTVARRDRKVEASLETANLPARANGNEAKGWVRPEVLTDDVLDEEDAMVDSYLKFLGRS